MSDHTPAKPKADSGASAASSGLEAAIIFVMVFVFVGIIFINNVSKPAAAELSLERAKGYLLDHNFGAAMATATEILDHHPGHEIAKGVLTEATAGMNLAASERDDLTARVTRQEVELANAKTELSRRTDELNGMKERLGTAQGHLQGANVSLEQCKKTLQANEAGLTAANSNLEALKAQIKSSNDTFVATRAQLDDARRRADAQSKALEESKQLLAEHERQLAQKTDAVTKATAAADSVKGELSKMISDFEDQRAAYGALEKRSNKQEDDLQVMGASLAEAEEVIGTVSSGIEKLFAAATTLEEEGNFAQAVTTFGYVLLLRPDHEDATKRIEICKEKIKKALEEE